MSRILNAGLWPVACGLWPVACGLWSTFLNPEHSGLLGIYEWPSPSAFSQLIIKKDFLNAKRPESRVDSPWAVPTLIERLVNEHEKSKGEFKK